MYRAYYEYALHLDLIIMGSSWCGPRCEGPSLPNAPEHAVSVEVFDAGRVDLGGYGDAFAKDILVHVSGPGPAASYHYDLFVEIRGYDGEDECEC